MVTTTIFLVNLILAALLALVLRVLLEDRVTALLVRYFGGLTPKGRRKVTGIWYSAFWYQGKDDRISKSVHFLRFKSLGTSVVAQTIAGPHHRYQMRGRLKYDSYLTGTWDNLVGDNIYHGAFQSVIEPEGDAMSGRWVGFNKRHVIGGGPWVMVRLSRDIDEDTERKIREEAGVVEGQLVFHKVAEEMIRYIVTRQSSTEAMPKWAEVEAAPNPGVRAGG